jgi:hypothetical protein
MKAELTGRRCAAAAAPIGMTLGAAVRAAPIAEDIRDIRGPIYVLPEWVLAALVGGAVLIALGIYALWRRRRNRAVRVLLPHELALQRLEDIGALMQPARAREFSTAASDIVRQYIEQRFSVTATRRTTEEFLRDLLGSSDAALAQHQGLLGEFLHQCDVVKFAAQSLTQRNMESLRESARAFVLATVATHDPLPAT